MSFSGIDRFIRRSFYLAVSIYKPDVIIFLGDLMNEGSSSSDKEYEEYKSRFDSIFPISLLNSVVTFSKF
jgi:ethanolamine phosphate phosphodiesterase